MKFGFIGAGKVGFSLGKYLADNGQMISGYYSKNEKHAQEAAEFTDSQQFHSIEQLTEDSDFIFLTVPDGQISGVWEQLKAVCMQGQNSSDRSLSSLYMNKTVCHCSGALSSEVFVDMDRVGYSGYSIHPLFAVSDRYHSYKEFSNIYFIIEGKEPDKIKSLFESFGNPVHVISKDVKIKYHCAAAIASNLAAGLISISEKLLVECGFDEESAHGSLEPIIRGNTEHIINDGITKALTGPVERNDVETVKKHLSVLEGNDRMVYLSLSRQVLDIAGDKNRETDYSEIKEILK